MKPKDYINKKATEEALKAFGATQLNNNQESPSYFVGKINASRTKITDPATGKEYDLIFTGNPKEYELAQRLSDNKAVVNAQQGAKMNVDGTLYRNYLVLRGGAGTSSFPTSHFLLKDINKNRLYPIPDNAFPISKLAEAIPGEVRSLGNSFDTRVHIEGSSAIFSEDGKSILLYYIITQQDTPNTIWNGPYEIVWLELDNIQYSSEEYEDEIFPDLITYSLEFNIKESGSYLITVDDLIYSKPSVPSISTPDGYELHATDSSAAVSFVRFASAKPVFYYSGEKIFGISFFYVSDRRAVFDLNVSPPPVREPSQLNVTTFVFVQGMSLIDLKVGTKTFLPEYVWNSGSPSYFVIITPPPPVEVYYTAYNLNSTITNKLLAAFLNASSTAGGLEQDPFLFYNFPFDSSGESFKYIKTAFGMLVGRYYYKYNETRTEIENSGVDRFFVDTLLSGYESTTYNASQNPFEMYYQENPDSVWCAGGRAFVVRGAFNNSLLSEAKRLTPAQLYEKGYRVKSLGQKKALILNVDEDLRCNFIKMNLGFDINENSDTPQIISSVNWYSESQTIKNDNNFTVTDQFANFVIEQNQQFFLCDFIVR